MFILQQEITIMGPWPNTKKKKKKVRKPFPVRDTLKPEDYFSRIPCQQMWLCTPLACNGETQPPESRFSLDLLEEL
jgi:hypothetical protein